MKRRIIYSYVLLGIGGCMIIIGRITEAIVLHRLGFTMLFLSLVLLPSTKGK